MDKLGILDAEDLHIGRLPASTPSNSPAIFPLLLFDNIRICFKTS